MRIVAKALGRWRRQLAARLWRQPIPVVYRSGYRSPLTRNTDPERAEKILGYLRRRGCLPAGWVRRPERARMIELRRVHEPAYLDRLDGPERVDLEPEHKTGERFRVLSGDERRDVLIDLVMRRNRQHAPFEILFVEWLLLQNSRAEPTPDRPLLPGQEHPGLGCLQEIILLLVLICDKLGLDGVGFTPATYHVAVQHPGRRIFVRRIQRFGTNFKGCPFSVDWIIIAPGTVQAIHFMYQKWLKSHGYITP